MDAEQQTTPVHCISGDLPTREEPREVEFHIRADVRKRYDFDDALFWSTGKVIFADFRAVQDFAERLNHDRPDHDKISPAALNAAALMDELLHFVIARYRETVEPNVVERALSELTGSLGSDAVDRMLISFLSLFPTTEIYRSETRPQEYLEGKTGGISNRALTLEELLINRLTNENPAFEPFLDLIRNDELRTDPVYEEVVTVFSKPPATPVTGETAPENLVETLRRPWKHAPYSLTAQLAYLRDVWSVELTPLLAERLAMSTGFIAEEHHATEMRGFTGGPGPILPPVFSAEPEDENFSPDIDWMPRVIMVAKNALVWLDQLSRKHGRPIRRLGEIPDEDIAQLKKWGFDALWLIGVWQRSEASQTLKQWTGNADAAPSAYSLFDYVISEELGGEAAVRQLSERCKRFGIRLASDMVPNHTGIDSKWIREHPDWFIQLPHPPYPSYRYSGESVGSPDGPILQVEDGYFDRSDAAVTFRRVDRSSGEERFIYHGNDGTGMPWNDTAQLDFTRADVREAVIQTILHVARLFPIIRFDAAMVLTKKHFHRLWYPEPGSGDGVPSRAAFGMRRAAFDARMPNEFWREVVDRVAQEVPDTLLLAEAFWLLEGYFVRTLGMHRVYNSAFMHMLMKEDNASYRDVIKKTVAFEPEILKRYVNFMSNPDEETAIEQFGDGDKYFGVCLPMLTLPGLPMIGHGQVEGLREKYGMEYRRAYLNEAPRKDLVERHEREMVPIAAKRHLFAEVEHFHLFDFVEASGGTNENVFAFSNRSGDARAFVLYNNRSENTRGWVRQESPEATQGGHPVNIADVVSSGLQAGDVLTFRDSIRGLEYVLTGDQLASEGLPVQLKGYEYRVLMDFAVASDDAEQTFSQLAQRLQGAGVQDLEEARTAAFLKPVVALVARTVRAALDGLPKPDCSDEELGVGDRINLAPNAFGTLLEDAFQETAALSQLRDMAKTFPWNRSSRYRRAVALVVSSLSAGSPVKATLVAKQLRSAMGGIDASHVDGLIAGVLTSLGLINRTESHWVIQMAVGLDDLTQTSAANARPIERFIPLVSSKNLQTSLGIHDFAGTVYFVKERFEVFAAAALSDGALLELALGAPETAQCVADHYDAHRRLLQLMNESDYQWTSLEKRIRRIRRTKNRPRTL